MLRVKVMLYLVRGVVLSGLVMWVAMELSREYWIVQLVQLEITSAPIVMMLGSPAIQASFSQEHLMKGSYHVILHVLLLNVWRRL